jgi:hypothetical protein
MENRKLDALVAEHVFGHILAYMSEQDVELCIVVDQATATFDVIPHYSSDIAAAWEVVAVLRGGLDFHLSATFRGSTDEHWRAAFTPIHVGDGWHAVGDTAPLAICLAALKVRGITP